MLRINDGFNLVFHFHFRGLSRILLHYALFIIYFIICRITIHKNEMLACVCNTLIIKLKRGTNFSNFFWNRTVHVSDRFSVHHQESSTVYTSTGVCHTGFADCLLAGSGWKILILMSYRFC